MAAAATGWGKMALAAPVGGRPRGEARLRLEQALRFISADFETMAMATGLPVEQVRRTLYNMRRSGVVGRQGRVRSPTSPRASRLVYGPPDAADDGCMRLAATICQAWR